jgi:riboflavin synthase
MFTGLIEDCGTLVGRNRSGQNWKLQVKTDLPVEEIKYGDSIAVNGTCLTVEEIHGHIVTFHTLFETLEKTCLGELKVGSKLNLERALRFGDRLDGHLVAGHVDTVTKICGIEKGENDLVVRLTMPNGFEGQFVEKGSVAIDGVSLTVAKLTDDWFSVHIIPVTWEKTIFVEKDVGDFVNIETDLLGKYIQRQVSFGQKYSSNVSMETLYENGFM